MRNIRVDLNQGTPDLRSLGFPHTKTRVFHLALHVVDIRKLIDPEEIIREMTVKLWMLRNLYGTPGSMRNLGKSRNGGTTSSLASVI